jgi:competence ComEA-like helix-hairpin-helix protein
MRMRKSVQLFALVSILITVSSFTIPAHAAPAPAATGVVNINTADAAQLALLPRIGMKAAERIVAYRTEHGAFAKTADLVNVKGVGEKMFERLAAHLTTEGETTLSVAATVAPTGVVNINTAGAAQLAMLPRIGMKAAERIVAYRTEHGPFAKTSDLTSVKGIGPKTFELLASYVTIEGETTLNANVPTPRKPKQRQQPQQQ